MQFTKRLSLLLLIFLLVPSAIAQVQNIDIPNGLYAFSFQEDKNNNIWIGLSDGNISGGLGLYANGKIKIISNSDSIPNGSYHTSIKLPDGSIMFGGNITNKKGSSLLVWISSMGIDTIQIPFARINPFINCMTLVNRRDIWIGTANGLLINSRGQWSWFTSQDGLPDNFITSIYQDFRGVVWVGTENGLAFFIDGTLHTTESGSTFVRSVTNLFGDNRGYLWSGSRFSSEGVSVYNGKTWQNFSARHGLADNSASIFHQDALGNLWVGSCYNRSRGGLSRFDGQAWTGFSSPKQLAKPCVDAIISDSNGRLWIGGSLTSRKGSGITVLDGDSWRIISQNKVLPAERVIKFFSDSNDNIWVSSFEGLFIVSPTFIPND